MRWKISGKTSAIQRLRIYLEGREEATYRRGTSTYTDSNVFTEIDLIDTTSPMKMSHGHVSLNIPGDTIHSFVSDNNKIIWSLKVSGDIARWPDIENEFKFTVLPMDRGSFAG